ncbi:MAG TPA: trypsin-like peptidase domain-containing protein [Candidatus Dormibacteraeota bacterium]|nr:trypsin-like peptidase domain-containing protein [Candidatus Dormibacteraeota bacterium]
MVAQELFDNHSAAEPAEAAPTPPASPPPKNRMRGRLAAGILAVALASGAGSGALTATLLSHNTPTAAATTPSTGSSTTAVSSRSATTAEAVYKQVSPGVVTINTVVTGRFGATGQGTGSGIVLDTRGDILTNNHVVAGAQQITVTFSDGKTVNATVVGTNSANDLAVIRVSTSASELHPVTLGNSDSVQVGDSAYAIGSPFGLSGSLTEGIVSNLHQRGSASSGSSLSNLIQTDAAINPGNSGGPLVNPQGEVIGINNAIESPVDANVGVGFAIPINQVKQLLSSLEGGSNV